jgi:S-DNA-T family DNA segregation ATPase FtsK/SpoIIIE
MYDLETADDAEEPEAPARGRRTPGRKPKLYDFADDFGPAPEKKQRRRQPPAPETPEFHQKPGMKHRSDDVQINPASSGRPGQWVLPAVGLLGLTDVHEVNMARVDERGKLLEDALASHGVETRLLDRTVGPTVTRFELELGLGVKVAKVTSLARDIAYSMAATDVRILAPIPGKSAIGVEVPNESRQLVSLGDLMVSPEAKAASHPLEVAVGKDIAGRAVFMNLASTPHLLIAGATGAGKSSGINSILTSLLMRSTPDEVRLILIDPKQVEMGQYARLPHLLTAPVTNPKKAANALGWAVKEMERRYDLLVEAGYRDIGGYNAAHDRGELVQPREDLPPYERLPFIVVVVDELNDLMMVAARDVEECITRIAQKARAVGIHLIVATQRPSVNVITGVIKANIPARMAFFRGVVAHRQPRHPRPARGGEAGGQGRHAAPAGQHQHSPAHPGLVGRRGGGAPGGGALARAGTRARVCQRNRGRRGRLRRPGRPVRRVRRRQRVRSPASGHGDRGAVRSREHVVAAAQAEGGLRPRRPAHGRARGTRCRRPE